MRHLHRPPPPQQLFNKLYYRMQELTDRANSGRNVDTDYISQLSAQPLPSEVRSSLVTMTDGLCAYCEGRLDHGSQYIDRYRPRSNAVNLDGSVSREHYWWLSFEWDNLFITCASCSRLKGSRFPIQGARAAIGTADLRHLDSERPLLINPCTDAPSEHLLFFEDGSVVSETDRGKITIETLGLNRASLVESRRDVVDLEYARWSSGIGDVDRRTGQISAEPYTELRRQLRSRWTTRTEAGQQHRDPRSATYIGGTPSQVIESRRVRGIKQSFDIESEQRENYSIESRSNQNYFVKSRQIERIRIENFRGIDNIDITISSEAGERAPWLALLGENGTGKSSILQAIALTLMGSQKRDELKLKGKHFVRSRGVDSLIQIWLTGRSHPVVLRIDGAGEFDPLENEPKVLLLGYGSTRLLPRKGRRPEPLGGPARVRNLFDPFVPLGRAATWLSQCTDDQFTSASDSIKTLLGLKSNSSIERTQTSRPRILVRQPHGVHEISQLSDGFQSIVAMTADILSVMFLQWETPKIAEGIVLIDELGNHLHPTWKMQIVDMLSSVFPRIQFIITTHDPLCLRGLGKGEVNVLRRIKDNTGTPKTIALTNLPAPKALRVDQLLTSELFGLDSTSDPEGSPHLKTA